MTQQVKGTTQKLSDSQCAQAYQDSLRCERTLADRAAPGACRLHCLADACRTCLGCFRRSAGLPRHWIAAAAAAAAAAPAVARRSTN